MDIGKILERAGKVRLQGGIFGKLTWAIIIICICITAIALAAGNIYVSSSTIVAMLIFAVYIFSKLLRFAEQNPQAAILDGAEYVMHEKIVHAAKGQGSLPPEPNTIDHDQPEITQDSADVEDVPPPKSLEER